MEQSTLIMLNSFLQEGRVQEFPNSSDTSGPATTQEESNEGFLEYIKPTIRPTAKTSDI